MPVDPIQSLGQTSAYGQYSIPNICIGNLFVFVFEFELYLYLYLPFFVSRSYLIGHLLRPILRSIVDLVVLVLLLFFFVIEF